MKQRSNLLWIVLCSASSLLFAQCGAADANGTQSKNDTLNNPNKPDSEKVTANTPAAPAVALDTAAYNQKLIQITNGDSSGRWPAKTPYPLAGAILPFKRVIAYYGNLYSKQMGVLGEYPEDEMIKKLQEEVKKWEAADPSTPVQPALHYIAVTAQGSPG
ncbi:MAG TPA: hypothetical protein VEB42_02120, partial [Chitinophagaceae bacterium]|nr:hypothetical protein [Chitinophagaceae bacterium]